MSVTIPAGEISVLLNTSIIDDNIFEANESFTLTINSSSLPSRVLVQPDCVLIITIVDDDGELHINCVCTYVRMYVNVCMYTCIYTNIWK